MAGKPREALRWIPVAERAPEVEEGHMAILLFQRWELDFESRQPYLVQWIRPYYGPSNEQMSENEKAVLRHWISLPPTPPLEKS